MKRFLYSLCLIISIVAVNSCKSNDAEPASPAIGRWQLERLRISGLVAPYASENGDSQINKNVLSDVFTVKSDNTVSGRFQSNGRIQEYTGTWTFGNNELLIKNDIGDEDTYTLDASTEPQKLLTPVSATSDTVTNPTTNKLEVVKYNIQFVYEKQ